MRLKSQLQLQKVGTVCEAIVFVRLPDLIHRQNEACEKLNSIDKKR